ncbi:MAG TPA: class III extradiol ring-cleavage dioxygenase [Kineosporiaceae bacterium]|nr:class III extradiol ring-cleavage dioxygenase [Kineosporiaceae bacterium]
MSEQHAATGGTAVGGPGRMPSLYLGHGAPPLVDDALWVSQLQTWSRELPRPTAILVVSAHWESAPLTIGATEPVGLVHDFWGFPEKYYRVTYPAPGAPDLAAQVVALMPDGEPVAHKPRRGLDHGAYVPLTVMYPRADIPVLQISLPSQDPWRLIELGRRLAPLRDQGVLIVGSGFMTHGLPFLNSFDVDQPPPGWSREFDAWAAEALAAGDVETLADFRHRAPAVGYAHPTADHFTPLFVILGTGTQLSAAPRTRVDGYWIGLSKRSVEVA